MLGFFLKIKRDFFSYKLCGIFFLQNSAGFFSKSSGILLRTDVVATHLELGEFVDVDLLLLVLAVLVQPVLRVGEQRLERRPVLNTRTPNDDTTTLEREEEEFINFSPQVDRGDQN